jgi:long-subunit fatty acid transport protein
MSANDALLNAAGQATAGATGATTIAGSMGALISLGVPNNLTLDQVVGLGNPAFGPVQKAQTVAGLKQLGIDTTMQIGNIQTAATGTAAALTANSAKLTATAGSGLLNDQDVDVTQTGSGITPILGMNLNLGEKLNIGIKYEFATIMDVKNKTALGKGGLVGFNNDATPIYLFPDGATTKNDMPAYLSIGANYAATEKLNIAVGLHYYFDKSVSYGKTLAGVEVDNKAVMDNNFYELAAGLEYKLSSKFLVSAGYLMTKTGVSPNYQTDMDFSLSTSTVGIGGQYAISHNLKLNFGYAYTAYKKGESAISHVFAPTGASLNTNQTYWKNTQIFSVGLDLSF